MIWYSFLSCKKRISPVKVFRTVNVNFNNCAQNDTRKHSSRMRTSHLETICASVSIATTRCHSQGRSSKVWTGLQWPPPDVTSRGSPHLMSRGRYPTMWQYPLIHLISPPSFYEQTDACENFTFPQTYLQAVIKRKPHCFVKQSFACWLCRR